MQDFMDDLGKVITETAEVVSRKTGEVVEIQKLKSQIRTMERNNQRDFVDLGKILFEKYQKGDATEEEYVAICEEIEKRNSLVKKQKLEISRIRGE